MTTAPDDVYRHIAERYLARPGVTEKRMLRSVGLAGLSGKVFSYLGDDGLVVKLPVGRVDELEQVGQGQRLTSGTRIMREWVVVPAGHVDQWSDLVDEAARYAG